GDGGALHVAASQLSNGPLAIQGRGLGPVSLPGEQPGNQRPLERRPIEHEGVVERRSARSAVVLAQGFVHAHEPRERARNLAPSGRRTRLVVREGSPETSCALEVLSCPAW